jgi:hypothetical protein
LRQRCNRAPDHLKGQLRQFQFLVQFPHFPPVILRIDVLKKSDERCTSFVDGIRKLEVIGQRLIIIAALLVIQLETGLSSLKEISFVPIAFG